jgi:hypothetical protein
MAGVEIVDRAEELGSETIPAPELEIRWIEEASDGR